MKISCELVFILTVILFITFTFTNAIICNLEEAEYNLVTGKPIASNSTCGETPEDYCTLTSTSIKDRDCSVCDKRISELNHPIDNTIDCDQSSYWKSKNNERFVQIDIDFQNEYYVAFIILRMGPSPHPRAWIIQKSIDFGRTYVPMQYFAPSGEECYQRYGFYENRVASGDEQVICSTQFSKIDVLENKEMIIQLISDRPGSKIVTENLKRFCLATNIRFIFQDFYTLGLHVNSKTDESIHKRLYYSISDIIIGGLCFCNHYADKCYFTKERNFACNCTHNTCGTSCQKCCPLYNQFQWQPYTYYGKKCEACNCHGHADECYYDKFVDLSKYSLDINNQRNGGGVCVCKNNTKGVNCEDCLPGFSRPVGAPVTVACAVPVCKCNSYGSLYPTCDENGNCHCRENFMGPRCDKCDTHHYNFPHCESCQCNPDGSVDLRCDENGHCICKGNIIGQFCDCCPSLYYGFPNCKACTCYMPGSLSLQCNSVGKCSCKSRFSGDNCDNCAIYHHSFPKCDPCRCNWPGTVRCDSWGNCECKENFSGPECFECSDFYYNRPQCRSCNCSKEGAISCDNYGNCTCKLNVVGTECTECSRLHWNFPYCQSCNCHDFGTLRCDQTGKCICKEGFVGPHCQPICRCHQPGTIRCDNSGKCICKNNFDGPECRPSCDCFEDGTLRCDAWRKCLCKHNFMGTMCDKCSMLYYDFPTCKSCNCYAGGTISCHPLGKCICKTNFNGDHCNRCSEFYYKFPDCIACDCSTVGTQRCDMWGRCECKHNFQGHRCDQCIDFHYNFPICEPCKCYRPGTHSCDWKGTCICKTNFEGPECRPSCKCYQPGTHRCDENGNCICKEKFVGPECRPICNCVGIGTEKCDAWGNCICRYNFQGLLCDDCAPFYFDYPNCRACDCSNITAIGCDHHGNCLCKPIFQNHGCSQCIEFYYDYPQCKPCNCYRPGTLRCEPNGKCVCKENVYGITCHSVCDCDRYGTQRCNAWGECECRPNFQAIKCDKCAPFYYDYPNCHACRCYQPGTHSCLENGRCICKENFDGPECHPTCRCHQPGTVRCDKDGKCICKDNFWGPECRPVCNCSSHGMLRCDDWGNCICKPNYQGPHCDICTVFHYNYPHCNACNCSIAGTAECNNLGICKCKPNFKGLGCFECNDFYYDFPLCSPCKCHQTGTEKCDQYGKCICKDNFEGPECRLICKCNWPGTKFCDENGKCVCKKNVFGDQCESCISNHFDFPRCSPCACHEVGSRYLQCYDDGSCRCKSNYCGKKCEECAPYHYDFPKCLECNCYSIGSLTQQCDDSGTCTCRPNYTGPKCDASDPVPCGPKCDCNPIGSKSEDCDKNGTCTCKELFNGTKCNQCIQNHWGFPDCQSCDCDPEGSESTQCYDDGSCPCKAYYGQKKCDGCAPNHWGFPNCQPCDCHSIGSEKQQCSSWGICHCRPFFDGEKCNQCKSDHWGFPYCHPCHCHSAGSEISQCYKDGRCPCKASYQGVKCNECKVNNWGFPDCESCDCHSIGSTSQQCYKNGSCPCEKKYSGLKCNECELNHFNFPDCDPCDCDPIGSQSLECTADGSCPCVAYFAGLKCDDCESNHWGYPECRPCGCHPLGSKSMQCNELNGYCSCNKQFSGSKCDNCAASHWDFPNCKTCDCDKDGSEQLQCSENGQCPCKAYYNGKKCDECDNNHYGYPNCKPCDCHPIGSSESLDCSNDGSCFCKSSFTGIKCNECKDHHFNFPNCEVCECHFIGSASLHCYDDGTCACKAYYKGRKCDECELNHYGFPNCQPCDCHSLGTEPGKCFQNGTCHCKANVVGEKCDQCAPSYWGFPNCHTCNCSQVGSESDGCDNSGDCKCNNNIIGSRCNKCAKNCHSFPNCYDCNCNSKGSVSQQCDDSGYCKCKANAYGEKCDQCANDAADFPNCQNCGCNPLGSKSSECNEKGHCRCKNNIIGEKCDKCEANYWNFPNCTFLNCNPFGSTELKPKDGICPCKPNITGKHCEACKKYHYGFPTCKSCECNAVGSVTGDCDQYGICKCKNNVIGMKCNLCPHNFWGFPNCQSCNCNFLGSLSESCDKNGYCFCKPNVIGSTCNLCQKNSWNFPECTSANNIKCNIYGSKIPIKHNNSVCLCKPNISGILCDACAPYYWDFPHCKACDCNEESSLSKSCNISTGSCKCKPNYSGQKCHLFFQDIFTNKDCDGCSTKLQTYALEDINNISAVLSSDIKDLSVEDLQWAHLSDFIQQHTDLNIQLDSLYIKSYNWYYNKKKSYRLESKIYQIEEDVVYLEKTLMKEKEKSNMISQHINLIQEVSSQTIPIVQQISPDIQTSQDILEKAVFELLKFSRSVTSTINLKQFETIAKSLLDSIKKHEANAVETLKERKELAKNSQEFLKLSKRTFPFFKKIDVESRQIQSLNKRVFDLHHLAVNASYSHQYVSDVKDKWNRLKPTIDEILSKLENIEKTILRSVQARRKYDKAFGLFKILKDKVFIIKQIQGKLGKWLKSNAFKVPKSLNNTISMHVEKLDGFVEMLKRSVNISPVFAFVKHNSDKAYSSLNFAVDEMTTAVQNVLQFLSELNLVNTFPITTKQPIYEANSSSENTEFEFEGKSSGFFDKIEVKDEPISEWTSKKSQLDRIDDDDDDDAFSFSNEQVKVSEKLESLWSASKNSDIKKGMESLINQCKKTLTISMEKKQNGNKILDQIGASWNKIDTSKQTIKKTQNLMAESKTVVQNVQDLFISLNGYSLQLDQKIFKKHLDYTLNRVYNASSRVRQNAQQCKELENKLPHIYDCQLFINSSTKQVMHQKNLIVHKFSWLKKRSLQIQSLQERISKNIANLKSKIKRAEILAKNIPGGLDFSSPGYIQYSKLSSKSSPLTKLEMNIRTTDTWAMLFYMQSFSNQSYHHFYLHLNEGRLVLTWKTPNEEINIKHPDALLKHKWNNIISRQFGNTISIELNGVLHEVSYNKLLPFHGISHQSNNLYIGGVSDSVKALIGFIPDMDGCVSNLRFNGVSISLLTFQKAIGVQQICPYAWNQDYFEVSFDGNGFLELNAHNITNYFNPLIVEFNFSTSQRKALLMYVVDSQKENFLLIKLTNGSVNVFFNIKNNITSLQSHNHSYHDGRFHNLKFEQKKHSSTLILDKKDRKTIIVPTWTMGTRIGTFYIGGVHWKNHKRIIHSEALEGCIANFSINEKRVGLNYFKASEGISFTACQQQRLFSCISFDDDTFPITLQDLKLGSKPLSLEFKTEEKDGIVFQFTNQIGDVLFAMHRGLIKVQVKYFININKKDEIINMTSVNNLWHTVLIQELKDRLVLIVDGSIIQISKSSDCKITSPLTTLILGGPFYDHHFLQSLVTQKYFKGNIRNLMLSTRLVDLHKFVSSNQLQQCHK